MAIINLSVLSLKTECPDIVFTDSTNYATSLVFPYSTFRFHDYGLGNPTLNDTIVYDTFVFGTPLSGVGITVETDGVGNFINAEIQYQALVDQINTASNIVHARLVKPQGTTSRAWYIEVYTSDITFAGLTPSVNVTGGATAYFPTISANVPITARNLTIYDTDDKVLDIGAIAQVDKVTFTGIFTLGESVTINFCNELITIIVNNPDPECVAKQLHEAILASGLTRFKTYVTSSREKGVITLTAKEAGVPLNIGVSYSGTGTIVLDNVTANVSSLSYPSLTENIYRYTTKEHGGNYRFRLTVVSECNYNTVEVEGFNWCWDLNNLECCFLKLIQNGCGCCEGKDKQEKASIVRNVLYAVPIMIDQNYSESDIQKVVDIGISICSPLNCGCNG